MDSVPVIDLSNNNNEKDIINKIVLACSTYGFFQIINHGIDNVLIDDFRTIGKQYFISNRDNNKNKYRRNENNSRGYFDNEYTKQKLDWKEAFDFGIPGGISDGIDRYNNWDKNDKCLDGWNQFPTEEEVPNFKEIVIKYYEECAKLSHTLTKYMIAGILKCTTEQVEELCPLIHDLQQNHTSYLRLNYYPICEDIDSTTEKKNDDITTPSILGISPHKDAGFVTILLQDDNDCNSLQVYYNGKWYTITPYGPYAFTINTGDMAQIYSNQLFHAPLHRVLTNTIQTRFSAPFFYNPSYNTYIQPYNSSNNNNNNETDNNNNDNNTEKNNNNNIKYHPCLWGYFRALRFAGDLTDLGIEIQIDDFEIGNNSQSKHLQRQAEFIKIVNFNEPFSVEKYRSLLES